MIEALEKISNKQVSSETLEVKTDIRDYFNKRLIIPEIFKYFNKLYDRFYKCLVCYDVIFDPIYCSECQLVFCSSCVSKGSKSKNLNCLHSNLLKELPALEKLKFEKIKVKCFFNCSNKNLNLLTYQVI